MINPELLEVIEDGQIKVAPEQVIDRKRITRKGKEVEQVLVQWLNMAPTDATWEDVSVLQNQFPGFLS